jgi:anaerobic selenocysteine-containing dehydrogenase
MLVQRRTLCNRDCPDTCGIIADVQMPDPVTGDDAAGRVVRLRGDPDHPVTRGFLCYRTSHFLERQYSPERLTAPLLRRRSQLEPASWTEALDHIAERLTAIRAESGPTAILHYKSGGSLGVLKLLSEYFFEQLGPCATKRGDICSGAGDFAQATDFGESDSHDLFDLHNARNILLWGKNVYTSSPHLIPILKQVRERGAGLVLIDPIHHRTAGICDAYHAVRPGGDFALAMAVAAVLFERGWVDPAAATYCDHLDALRALATSQTVHAWCAQADLAPAVAEDLARRLGPGGPTAILVGWGMGRRWNGVSIVRALDALCAISGNLGRPGGGVSFYYKRRAAFDTSFVRGKASAPRTVCEPLLGQEILAASDPPIRAVWVTAGNPVAMLPDSETTARALRSRELVVVVDSFLTDTADCATVVLPTTTLLEDDDLLGAYGHHHIGASRPVVAPPPGCKTDLQILQALAARLGDPALIAAMAGDARAWKARIMAPRLDPHGITLETMEQAPGGVVVSPLAKPVLFADRRFPTASGRVNLLTAAPAAPPDLEAEGYPLTLMSLSTPEAQSSQWAKRPGPEPTSLTVHPASAGGIADGARARLESRWGAMEVVVRHDPAQRRDTALVPKGGHLSAGRCANALIRARTTDAGEGGALYDERVRLVPLAAG